MAFCHGNGDLARDGCCYVDGAVCPLRWKIVDNRILEGPDLVDRGTVEQFAASVSNNPNIQQRIIDQAVGLTFACRAAVEVLVNDAKLLNDRAGFEAAWNAHPDYQALVAPSWRQIEQRLGLPEGTLDCATWKGTGGPQCCFTEDQATNDAKSQGLSQDARDLRQGGGE